VISAISSSLSALSAFKNQAQVIANNVANVNTDGFKKSRTEFKSEPGGGVSASVNKVNTPGGIVAQQTENGLELKETSNVDLAEEFVNLIVNERAFEANVKTIQAEDEKLGNLLDVIA
jgi:flagellar basal-body rod protein FlgC